MTTDADEPRGAADANPATPDAIGGVPTSEATHDRRADASAQATALGTGDDAESARSGAVRGDVTPALPSVGARVIGFVAILVAGAAGGFIGYAVTELQCTGDCTTAKGLGGLIGAVIVAVGVAIVVQLALRAMSEWRTIQARGGPEAERQRQRAVERRLPPESRPRPRVR